MYVKTQINVPDNRALELVNNFTSDKKIDYNLNFNRENLNPQMF